MKTLTSHEVQQINGGSLYIDFLVEGITLNQVPALNNALNALNAGTMNAEQFNAALLAAGINSSQYHIDVDCTLSYHH